MDVGEFFAEKLCGGDQDLLSLAMKLDASNCANHYGARRETFAQTFTLLVQYGFSGFVETVIDDLNVAEEERVQIGRGCIARSR